MKKLMLLVAILISVTALIFGAGQTEKGTNAKAQTFYMVTHCQPTDAFWAQVYKGMNDAAKVLGVKAVYLGSKTSGDVAEMVNNLETAIEAHPDGIAISITNAAALEPLLRQAVSSGIPVVAINVADLRPEGQRIPYLRYIGEDSYMTGSAVANAVLTLFQQKYGRPPKMAIYANHEPANIVQAIRGKGVTDTVKKAGTEKVEVVEIAYDPAKAVETIRAYLQSHPDVEYIQTANESVAHWMVGLLEESNRLGTIDSPAKEGLVYVGGIDLSKLIVNDVIAGKVVATIEQQPYLQGLFGIQLLYMWNRYRYLPANDISTGPLVIKKDNAQQILNLLNSGQR